MKYEDLKSGILLLALCVALVGCFSKREVLKPENKVNIAPTKVTDDEVSIISYNIKAVGTKDTAHTQALADYIIESQFDVVLLQEVFSEETRGKLFKLLSPHYPTIVDRMDYCGWNSLWQDSGIFICSKFDAVDISKLELSEDIKNKGDHFHKLLNKEVNVSLDAFANKSIGGVLLEVGNGKKMLAMTTHAQAIGSRSHKRKQLVEMHKVANVVAQAVVDHGLSSPESLAVILTGDFNVDAYVLEEDYTKLLTLLGQPIDLYQDVAKDERGYSFSAGIMKMLTRFDYIFSWDSIAGTNMAKMRSEMIQISDVQVGGVSISDHYPLVGVLQYR